MNLHKVRKEYEKCRKAKRRALLIAAVSTLLLDDKDVNGDDTMTLVLAGAVVIVARNERKLRVLRQVYSEILSSFETMQQETVAE